MPDYAVSTWVILITTWLRVRVRQRKNLCEIWKMEAKQTMKVVWSYMVMGRSKGILRLPAGPCSPLLCLWTHSGSRPSIVLGSGPTQLHGGTVSFRPFHVLLLKALVCQLDTLGFSDFPERSDLSSASVLEFDYLGCFLWSFDSSFQAFPSFSHSSMWSHSHNKSLIPVVIILALLSCLNPDLYTQEMNRQLHPS